jgi:hypothetical protein
MPPSLEERPDDDDDQEGILDKKSPTKEAWTEESKSAVIAEPEEEDCPEEDDVNGSKFVLLERLFTHVRQEGQLNAVLSGYFAKLITLLINRKQK